MNRVELVRQVVDEIVQAQPDTWLRRWGLIHLYGVSQAATLLALRRGLDPDLATVAGLLHDLDTYRTKAGPDHADRSAALARHVLGAMDGFLLLEVEAICTAISRHMDKEEMHGPLDELLKDADVWQHYLYDTAAPPRSSMRADALRREFQIV